MTLESTPTSTRKSLDTDASQRTAPSVTASPRRLGHPTPGTALTLLCGAAIFLGSLILAYVVNRSIVRHITTTGDEPWYLMQTYSLIHYHTVDLARIVHNPALYHQFLGGPDDHTLDYVGNGERMLPNLPGYAALMVPFYIWKGRLGIVTFQALLAALTATLLFAEGTRLFRSRLAGFFASLAYLFALPALLYVSQIFPSVTASFVAFAGYIVAMRVIPAARGWWLLPACGALAILVFILPWLHNKYALAAIVLVALAAWGLRRRLRWPLRSASASERLAWTGVALVAGSLVVSFLLIGLYCHHYYGSWTPRISRVADSSLSLRHLDLGRGFTLYQDVFLSRSSGLLSWVPLDLLVLPGLVLVWRRSRRDGLAVTLMLAALLGIFASAFLTTEVFQGLAFPSRFSVEAAPFFALCVAGVFAAGVRALSGAVAAEWARRRQGTQVSTNDMALPEGAGTPSGSILTRGALYAGAGLVVLVCVLLLAVSGYFTVLGAHDPAMIYGSPAGPRMAMKYPDKLPAWWFYAFPETPGTLVYTRTMALDAAGSAKDATTGEHLSFMHTSTATMPPGVYRATYTFTCTRQTGDTSLRVYVDRLISVPGTSYYTLRTIVERDEPISVCTGNTTTITLTYSSDGYEPNQFYVAIVRPASGSGTAAKGTITGTATYTPVKLYPTSWLHARAGSTTSCRPA